MTAKQPCILLVDDEPVNLIVLEELLVSEGYHTISASCGEEALEIANKSRPNLILLDVMMPDIDGFEVCDRLRQNSSLQTIPIIFLTALQDEQSKLKGLELMSDDYITKPFNSSFLLAKVASILKLSELRTGATQSQAKNKLVEETQQQLLEVCQTNDKLLEKLQMFVPEQFLAKIAPQGIDSIQLGNLTEEEMTILFCDIRGFTSIAESQTAKDTFEWLNAFFNQMSDRIASNRGFIDKFLGDAIMAVFNMPKLHVIDALNAAIVMQDSLKEFNASRHLYNLKKPIKIGIGIHTGIATIGTIGSDKRMDSTAIGDVVNTASRLESLTKVYDCPIIVSDAVISQLESNIASATLPERHPHKSPKIKVEYDLFYYRWLDKVTPRGKQTPVDLYEIIGTEKIVLDEAKLLTKPIFNKAIKGWKKEKFVAALAYFQQVLERNPNDNIAKLYVERCQEKLCVTFDANKKH
ncbi:MAG: response regulator [Cyanobacteriota bacterium]|nr:response regulator [Cyanobacteriota bacterium]